VATPRRHDCHYNLQVAGLALHALEPDEEIDVLEHIRGCPSCRVALADAERALAGLGTAVPQVDPPDRLRGSLLAAAAETLQVQEGGRPLVSADEPSDRPASVGAQPPAARRGPGPRPGGAGRGPDRPPGTAAGRSATRRRLVAAALAVVAVLAIGGLGVRSAMLAAELDAETAQAQALAEVVLGLDRPGSRHANLTAPDGGVLAVLVVHDGRRTLVRSAALRPNDVDRDTYVVWGVAQGEPPRAIAAFDVTSPEAGVLPVGSDAPADGFSAYAISIEPGRTAPAAPTTVLASGVLPV
jgi:hypothetical protein